MYKCKYFRIEELVHPILMKRHTEEELWDMFAVGMLKVLDRIKELACEKAGENVSVKINDWYWGGGYTDSGLRVNYGSRSSSHRFGIGFDLKIKGWHPRQVHQLILDNEEELWKLGLKRMESLKATVLPGKTPWTHIDGKYVISSAVGKVCVFLP